MFFTLLACPVLEYACVVYHNAFPNYSQVNDIEYIQMVPRHSYSGRPVNCSCWYYTCLADRPSQKIVPQCTSCSQLAIIAIVRFLKLLTAAKIVPYNLRKRRQKPFHSPINLQKKCRKLCNCFFYPTILWFVVFTKSFLTWLPNGNLVLFCGLVTNSNPFAILPRISARKHFVAFRRYS